MLERILLDSYVTGNIGSLISQQDLTLLDLFILLNENLGYISCVPGIYDRSIRGLYGAGAFDGYRYVALGYYSSLSSRRAVLRALIRP